MFIGKINDQIGEIRYTFKKRNLDSLQKLREEGNPFYGETVIAHWKEMTTDGVDLYVSLENPTAIDQLVLHFGEKSSPHLITLYTADKERVLDTYAAETGKKITETVVELSVDDVLSEFVIEFCCDFTSVSLTSVDIFGSIPKNKPIFPTPLKCEIGNGTLAFVNVSAVLASTDDEKAAATVLQSKLEEKGVSLAKEGACKIELVQDASITKNSYKIVVNENGARLSASDRRGLVLAAETLLKLADADGIPYCDLTDEPFCEFRGVHLYLPSKEKFPFFKKFVRYVLSPMGYNFIIMEVAGTLRFDSHPEINEALQYALKKAKSGEWPPFPHGSVADGTIVEKSMVRELVEYVEGYGLTVVPEIQSLGHVQFMTQAHPDIAERPVDEVEEVIDERFADIPPKQFYAHSYCPSNPKSYEILFDLIDEIVEVFQPKEYVHMGHDEVYQIGVCPKCKGKDPAELFAYDVNRIHDYLATKGLKMMIWSDMIQPVTKYQTPSAIDMIPKDILMLDFIWYFHMNDDIEDNLLAKDFSVLFGNLYSSHFPRFEKRIRSKGMRGGQISAWVNTDEAIMGREGKIYDFIYTAQMLWSESYSHCNRYTYDRMISALIPELREKLQGVSYPSLSGGCNENVLFRDEYLDLTSPLSNWKHNVNDYAKSLRFDHSCTAHLVRIPWVALEEIGSYVVNYEDGSKETISLTYGGNICHWDRRQNEPFKAGFYRHNGYCGTWFSDGKRVETSEGKLGTVYSYEWINPKPDTKITTVQFVSAEGTETQVCLMGLSLFN